MNRARTWLFIWLLLFVPLANACQQAPLLSNVAISSNVIRPNGNGVDDRTTISYEIGRDAVVSLVFRDASGKEYQTRDHEPRSAGSFQAEFDGVYPLNDGTAARRVMPNGDYTFVLTAEDAAGMKIEKTGTVTIADADTTAPEIRNLTVSIATISPNGDGDADETTISYGVSKDSEVVLFAEDQAGQQVLLSDREPKKAALYSFYWNGTANGRTVADGIYTIHVQAFDSSGNVSEATVPVKVAGAGKPELKITRAEFTPIAVPLGGKIDVTIHVKNTGDTPIKTLGPPSGTAYRTDQTYNYWTEDDGATPKYYERPGRWRVAVSWNLAGSPFPVRWGLFADTDRELMPGEETVVTGTITVLAPTPELRFWASIEQGGVGFPGGEVGLKTIRIGY